jgi:formylglycine-generating enzyme required for sulfatase activity
VRGLAPNQWGLYDMRGNVWEWCADSFGDYTADDQVDPAGSTDGRERVGRGGSWFNPARYCRSACRNAGPPGGRGDVLGFRLA